MENKKITIIKEKLYTLREVAEILRVSERSMFRYIYSGRLKASKIGYWRIMGKDVIDFLSSNIAVDYIKETKKTKKVNKGKK